MALAQLGGGLSFRSHSAGPAPFGDMMKLSPRKIQWGLAATGIAV